MAKQHQIINTPETSVGFADAARPNSLGKKIAIMATALASVVGGNALRQPDPVEAAPHKQSDCVLVTDPFGNTYSDCTGSTRPPRTTTTRPRTTTTKPKPKPSTSKPSKGGGSGGSGNGGSNGGSKTTQNASPTTTTAPEPTYEETIAKFCAGQKGEPRLAETLYAKRFHKDRAGEVVSVDGNGEVVIIAKYCDLVFVEPKTQSEGIDTNYGQIFRDTELDDELNAGQAGALDAYARSKWAEENAPAVNGFKAAVDGATKIGVDGLSKANLYPIDAGAISRFNAREL